MTVDSHSSDSTTDLFLGLDIGSVNARLALIDEDGHTLLLDIERILDGPSAAVGALLERLRVRIATDRLAGAAVCGAGRAAFQGRRGWQVVSSPYAAIAGVLCDHPEARTLVEVGGQSSFVVGLEGGLDDPWRVARTPLCAAGTGRFLEQQAQRLGISMDAFGPQALAWTQPPPRIAARCSVFAKSDLIHLQQKGWPVDAMLAGLSDSVARMVMGQWREPFVPPVLLVGGVAANGGVVRALSEALGVEVQVPDQAPFREALGAAHVARRTAREGDEGPHRGSVDLDALSLVDANLYHVDRRLAAGASPDGWQAPELPSAASPLDVYLGVDVGSTSTKAAVISPQGAVLAKSYHMTAGQPLEAVKRVMADLAPQLEGRVAVRAVGVTGSGRYLVGDFVGADLVKNEITAQARAALHIDPAVDTIFELGGQDSKYVYLENGAVLDYQMNKACAAGTGSFIDELAEQLGVPTRNGAFARLAFEADSQLDLGERCAAFMSQAVTSAQHAGVPLDVIAASLSASLAKNYRSKVLGAGRVGRRVFLTGAVFYNAAVAAAFQSEFPGKTFVVPLHKEVTGAIGAALLAGESAPADTRFKGFGALAQATYELSNFTCRHCENHCAISVMAGGDGHKVFYGSRCDRYDAAAEIAEQGDGPGRRGQLETPFTERERLLLRGYDPALGAGPLVGIPRALMSYDLAPLLLTFLNILGARTLLSRPTNKQVIERSLETAYTDSCFPIKLLHGHAADLLDAGAEYLLVPNAIRMGRKDGEEDQRYSCPLVQAAPYILRAALDLGARLLDPIIDLSRGDDLTVDSLTEVATRLGYTREQGRTAAQRALSAQRAFEADLQAAGEGWLARLDADPDAIGVVLLSRAYNAQDQGANLGITRELARLGVTPIPLDALPLERVDVRAITDRPYWNYERKILAGASLVSGHPRLYGLFLTNFGCGPNAVIENIVRDMMGGKPLGQIEVDEHAAEAGYITRLEAFVDTIRAQVRADRSTWAADPVRYTRRVPSGARAAECLLISRMADHADLIAAAARAFGVDARVLPESDERSMALSRDVTSGKECLPFRDTLGVLLRMAADGELPAGARAIMAGSFGPCRLGKYAQEQQKVLDEQGIALEILTTVSNNAYADLGLGNAFQLLAWDALLAGDLLQRLLWATRPYERLAGSADEAYTHTLSALSDALLARRPLAPILREAVEAFASLRDPALPHRPLVGINGEIYLRANRFCNKDLVAACEAHGLEAEVAPMSEWMKYVAFRRLEDAVGNREVSGVVSAAVRRLVMQRAEGKVARIGRVLVSPEPTTRDLLAASGAYLPARNGSEAVLSLGSGVRQMRDPHFAGVISVMPHGCMPGGIVAAIAESVSRRYGKPWISLTYDGFADRVNPERIADLAEQVKRRRV
ncbi:MAG: BadF/BadG/BcrA/BcrD ATPase family protein [Anaerolineae bacterium]